MFLKRPAIPLAAVTILAVAIAVASVLAALFAAAVYDDPPIERIDSVARVRLADATRPAGHRPASMADYAAWKPATRTLDDLAAFIARRGLVGDVDAASVGVLAVTPEYFRVTGRRPGIGRPFVATDDHVAIVSDRLWRDRLGGNSAIVGTPLIVDATSYVVVGVMTPDFWFPNRGVDVWLPLMGTVGDVDVAGRLRSGRSWSDVQAEFDVLARTRTVVSPAAQESRIRMGPGLKAFGGAALATLLIACANVGNLLVIRLFDRRRELEIRVALGASPAQIARLTATETAMLAMAAGVAGAVVARWAVTAVAAYGAAVVPPLEGAIRSGHAAIGAMAAMIIAAAALAPFQAWRVLRPGRVFYAKRYEIADLLTVAQVACAVVLVVVAVFDLRFFAEAVRISRPARADQLYAARVTSVADESPAERGRRLFSLLEEVRGSRDVFSAALTTGLPELGGSSWTVTVSDNTGRTAMCRARVQLASPTFFETLGLTFRIGAVRAGPAAVVSDSAAARCFAGSLERSPSVRMPSSESGRAAWLAVTGIVADPFSSRMAGVASMASYIWLVGTREWPPEALVIYASRQASFPTRVPPGIAIERPSPLANRLEPGVGAMGFLVDILGITALIAVLLAFTGVYAAMSESCARRMQEWGVRRAIGASSMRLVTAVLGHDFPLVVAGVMVGLATSLWGIAATWGDLLELNARDVRVWALILGVLTTAALLASVGPALKAIRADPAELLRVE